MLRISVHAGLPSGASRYNRSDWLDIGYERLDADAEYKIVLFQAGIGACEPILLTGYPRWSASLWDLIARAIACGSIRAAARRRSSFVGISVRATTRRSSCSTSSERPCSAAMNGDLEVDASHQSGRRSWENAGGPR